MPLLSQEWSYPTAFIIRHFPISEIVLLIIGTVFQIKGHQIVFKLKILTLAHASSYGKFKAVTRFRGLNPKWLIFPRDELMALRTCSARRVGQPETGAARGATVGF